MGWPSSRSRATWAIVLTVGQCIMKERPASEGLHDNVGSLDSGKLGGAEPTKRPGRKGAEHADYSEPALEPALRMTFLVFRGYFGVARRHIEERRVN
jgi:hypothetical protein